MNNLRQKIKDALFNKELIKKNLNHPFAEWEEEDICLLYTSRCV